MTEEKIKKSGLLTHLIRKAFPDPVYIMLGSSALADKIRGHQHAHVKSFSPLMLLTNFVCLLIVTPILLSYANPVIVSIWAVLMLSVILLGAKGIRFRWRVSSTTKPRKDTNSQVRNAIVMALVWALLPVLFFQHASSDQKVFIVSIVAGMMGGGSMALALIPVAARIFCCLLGLGAFVTLVKIGGYTNWGTAVLVIAYMIALSRLSWTFGKRFVQRFIDREELQQQQATISMLLKDFEDSSSDWMWETDGNGKIVSPSNRFCETVGMSQAQLESLELKSLISFEQPKASSERKNRPLAQKLSVALLFRDHHALVETNFGPKWWSLTGKPIVNDNGELTGFRGTASDIQESKTAEENLNRMARYDRITGLRNRSYFHELLASANLGIDENSKTDRPTAAILYVDLDGFKAVNNSLGHSFGDAVLREAANRLEVCITQEDIAARFGADQYCILLSGISSRSGATQRANEILKQLSRPFVIQGNTVSLTASIGVALVENHVDDPEVFVRNADVALARAKSEGGDKYEVFTAGMDAGYGERRQLEIELRQAVRLQQFVLHYQAVTDAKTGGVNTFEALIRWKHPTRGLVMPDHFIPLAEETGLINEIGDWVLQQACDDAASWAIPHRVAVNISAKQIMSQRLLLQVIKTLERSELSPERLELEVTESVLIENPERTRILFTEFRKLGISISLDDFGTGYSSLSYLVRFPFDKVKIDKSFIRSAEQSDDDMAIVRSILGLADNLGIGTIAEGIENEEQMRMVRREGCHEMQGYLINVPKPLHEIPALAPKTMTKERNQKPKPATTISAA